MLRRNVVLLGLPPRVAIFYSRARRAAARSGDRWSLESATGPRSLALLLRAARGRRRVVEIGTGTAWTTAALALADHKRRVLSFDPTVWAERERYLRLAGPEATTRIQLVMGGGEGGPGELGWRPDMLFVDGSHDRDLTIRTFESWRPALLLNFTAQFSAGRELAAGVRSRCGSCVPRLPEPRVPRRERGDRGARVGGEGARRPVLLAGGVGSGLYPRLRCRSSS